MSKHGLPAWYLRSFNWLVISTFFLICLGGSVRVMNAGLACPDWPLCFGDVIPDYHPQVYFEFIHRVVAGLVSIGIAGLFIILWRSSAPRRVKMVAVGATVLLLAQIIFGGLTVLLQLHSKVVAAHLGMGTGFFALLLWIYLSLKDEPLPAVPRWVKGLGHFLLTIVFIQILLGGMVASHFAALVCQDFPTCHGQWIPTLRGIIGLHVIHRLGAYFVYLSILVSVYLLWRTHLRRLSLWLLGICSLQIVIGIANVLLHTPPLIAVAHLGVGTLVLGIAVRIVHASRAILPSKASSTK